MSSAEEVFKARWAERNEEWYETFEFDGNVNYPTEPSQRVQCGLEAAAAEIVRAAVNLPDGVLTDDFAGGVLLAIEYLNGGELKA